MCTHNSNTCQPGLFALTQKFLYVMSTSWMILWYWNVIKQEVPTIIYVSLSHPAFDIRQAFLLLQVSRLQSVISHLIRIRIKPMQGDLFILHYHLILIWMWKILGWKPNVKFNTKDWYFSPILFCVIAHFQLWYKSTEENLRQILHDRQRYLEV